MFARIIPRSVSGGRGHLQVKALPVVPAPRHAVPRDSECRPDPFPPGAEWAEPDHRSASANAPPPDRIAWSKRNKGKRKTREGGLNGKALSKRAATRGKGVCPRRLPAGMKRDGPFSPCRDRQDLPPQARESSASGRAAGSAVITDRSMEHDGPSDVDYRNRDSRDSNSCPCQENGQFGPGLSTEIADRPRSAPHPSQAPIAAIILQSPSPRPSCLRVMA